MLAKAIMPEQLSTFFKIYGNGIDLICSDLT